MSSSNDSKQRITAISAVVGILLLGVIAFLLYNKVSLDKQIKTQAVELEDSNKVKTELEKNYYEALSNLEEMKGNNEELNALIESQKDELKTQKEKVDRLIRSGKANKGDLRAARAEIEKMLAQRDEFLVQIEDLKAQNVALTDANSNLTTERNSLQEAVTLERTNVENLNTEKAVLVSQKEELETVKADLTKKVTFGSVIQVENVMATGVKLKKSGKEAKRRNARNVDELKICFNTTINELAAAGNETFLVRLINPVGETIAVENMGSGVFKNNKTGEEIRYTHMKNVKYAQDVKPYCFNWKTENGFQKGIHEIEVYNKGYLAGTGSVKLK